VSITKQLPFRGGEAAQQKRGRSAVPLVAKKRGPSGKRRTISNERKRESGRVRKK